MRRPSASPFVTRVRLRAFGLQILLVFGLAAGLFWLAQNVAQNLAERNLALGFDFLSKTAGFAVSQSLIAYDEHSSYGRALLVGLLNTLLVSALGIVFATVLGFTLGIARRASNVLLAGIARVYVEILRNIPLLLQLFFWYFAVLRPLPPPRGAILLLPGVHLTNRGLYFPSLELDGAAGPMLLALGLGLGAAFFLPRLQVPIKRFRWRLGAGLVLGLPLAVWLGAGAPVTVSVPELGRFNFEGGAVLRPEFLALLFALSTYTAAFIAEIVRAGLDAVPRGQREAAQALGLSPRNVLWLVVVPQALRVIIPPLAGQYLNLLKNSSLAVAIAFPDLVSVFAGTALSQSGRAIEIVAITMGIYLALSLLTAGVMNLYNRHLTRVGP